MKFKSNAIPGIVPGILIPGKKQVVPNQSMSLEEILARFTRGEALPVAQPVNYHESDDDLEKVAAMDLVDKEEYIERLKATQKDYKKQEASKARKETEKLRAEVLAKIEAEEKQKRADSAEKSKVTP